MLFVLVKIRIISVTIQLTEPYIRSCKSLSASLPALLPDQYFTLPHLIPLYRSPSNMNQPTSYHYCHRHQEPNLWPWRMVPLWQPIRAALALSPSVELFQAGYTIYTITYISRLADIHHCAAGCLSALRTFTVSLLIFKLLNSYFLGVNHEGNLMFRVGKSCVNSGNLEKS